MNKNAIDELISLSQYAGERFDLIQAGGGNTSVKINNSLFVKASGYKLAEMTLENGYIELSLQNVKKAFSQTQEKRFESDAQKESFLKQHLRKTITKAHKENDRPSIETLLHAFGRKYTLHAHSLAPNILLSQKNWQEKIQRLFPQSMCVPYATPGYPLAVEIEKSLTQYVQTHGEIYPEIIFLQSHGAIINAESKQEVISLTENVVEKCEKELNLNNQKYKNVSLLTETIERTFSTRLIGRLETGISISSRKILKNICPLCPDDVVYWGQHVPVIRTKQDIQIELEKHKKQFQAPPQAIFFQDYLYTFSTKLSKCEEIAQLLKANLYILEALSLEEINPLDQKECNFLQNWEAEKYRKTLVT